jgi:hypothetical protein
LTFVGLNGLHFEGMMSRNLFRFLANASTVHYSEFDCYIQQSISF